jgi:hypothetical protein
VKGFPAAARATLDRAARFAQRLPVVELGQVDRADAGTLPPERAADVHQARVVGRGADLGAGVEHVAQLVGEHRHRRVGVLDRERPAEPAALLGLLDLDEVDALDRAQQPQRAVADLKQPQRMAGRVVGDAVRERGADILDLEHVDEELRQLAHAVRDRRAVLAHHRDARGRRGDDVLRVPEHALEAPRQRRALVRVPRVDVHLAAAGLLLGEGDLHAQPLQQLDDRAARAREQGVVEAGDEQCSAHRRSVVQPGSGYGRSEGGPQREGEACTSRYWTRSAIRSA